TREGQTRRIAEHVAATLRAHDFTVSVHDLAVELPTDFDLARCARALLAASIHIGKHEQEMVTFVKKHRAELERMPCMFLTVSMSQAGAEDASATPGRRARATVNVDKMIRKFLDRTGWKPTRVHPVAGALLYRQYRLPVRLMMRFIAKTVGAPTDTTRNHEFTDWRAVDRFAQELAQDVNAQDSNASRKRIADDG
ncbi:MAG TPA: flavodoxin domain-containing protein, partial [Casimicrobiaceae bacterium]|nr:flavodoxin domain-containing protein [Casimicrobiaceae bacterium]